MRTLREDERTHAAAIVAVWLVENAVQVTAEYPTGTNWVPVEIDDEARRLRVLVQTPGAASSLAEIPMLAVA
jgi:hypothetical protein